MIKNKTDKLGHVWMLPLAVFALGVFAPGMSAQSLPTCAPGTLAYYETEYGEGTGGACTIGGYTLEDFMSYSGGTATNILSPSQILVDPTVTSEGISVQFAATEGNSFLILSGDAYYDIDYFMDPLLPTIQGTEIDLGPNDPVSLIGTFCGGGQFSEDYYCGGPEYTLTTGSDTLSRGSTASGTFPTPQTLLDTNLDLELDCTGADVLYFGSTADTVPEPSMALVLPIMLVGLWFAKKKMDKRKTALTAGQ